MERKEAIRGAYRMTGGNDFYDGMITCSTLSGKAVCRLVWAMNKAENDAYLEKAMSGIPEHFSGKLLEVPVGTGILTMTNYPDSTPMDMFMAETEMDIAKSGIAEYSNEFKKIIDLQNKLYHFDRYSFLLSYSDYMNVYNHTDKMYPVLLEYEKDAEDENSFDLNMINKLGEFYSNYARLVRDNYKDKPLDKMTTAMMLYGNSAKP